MSDPTPHCATLFAIWQWARGSLSVFNAYSYLSDGSIIPSLQRRKLRDLKSGPQSRSLGGGGVEGVRDEDLGGSRARISASRPELSEDQACHCVSTSEL